MSRDEGRGVKKGHTVFYATGAVDFVSTSGCIAAQYLGVLGPRHFLEYVKGEANSATFSFRHRVFVTQDTSGAANKLLPHR